MKTGSTPIGLADLYRLGEQVEMDKSASVHALRQRDHGIGQHCDAADEAARLKFWLNKLPVRTGVGESAGEGWLTEATAAVLARFAAAILGFLGMATFLLSGGQGLVNVFVFLLLFVLVQLAFCLASALVMFRSVRGNVPVVLPLNPARWVVSRVFPDKRYLRESQAVLRLLFLRYGQEIGAIFTLGAVAAFFLVLAFSDFTFVWGSTFTVSNEFVELFTRILAWPWSSWLSAATLSPQVIADSRYHPSLTDLSQISVASKRGWWPFLIMATFSYALLPRVILWGLSKLLYVRLIKASFIHYPGAESILARMKSPVVTTQALQAEDGNVAAVKPTVSLDEGLILLSWAGALDAADFDQFEQILSVPAGNRLAAGLGLLADDGRCVDQINQHKARRLLVAVKAWEPPMADLKDFLTRLENVAGCTLCLVPLPRKTVTEHNLQEWADFSRELHFDRVQTQSLSRF
jgi:hypothetical protein